MKESTPINPENGQEYEEIPDWENLSESERKFVTSIKDLSEKSEEEFLEDNRELYDWIHEKYKEYQPDVDESDDQKIKRFRGAFRLTDQEEGRYLATMWELVELQLLKRKRVEEGEISEELEELAEKLITRFEEVSLGRAVPGKWQAWVRMTRESIDSTDIEEKLEIIDKLLHFKHGFDRKVANKDESLPAVYHGGVKDLWRYSVPGSLNEDMDISADKLYFGWKRRRFQARQFFVMLEQLGKGENNQYN